MKVYLVQHGEAAPEEQDPARHLTEKALQDAKCLGRALAANSLRPSEIWHSGKTRTQETAKAIAAAFEGEIPLVEKTGMAPNEHPGPLVDQLKDDVMVVGHQPFLGKMVGRMVSGHEKAQIVNFDHLRCACLSGDGKRWAVEWVQEARLLGKA